MKKTLTEEQAHVLIAFMECFDLHTTGAWSAIETAMRDDFGVADPEEALEDVKNVLRS